MRIPTRISLKLPSLPNNGPDGCATCPVGYQILVAHHMEATNGL